MPYPALLWPKKLKGSKRNFFDFQSIATYRSLLSTNVTSSCTVSFARSCSELHTARLLITFSKR